jgi:hypothetical protein
MKRWWVLGAVVAVILAGAMSAVIRTHDSCVGYDECPTHPIWWTVLYDQPPAEWTNDPNSDRFQKELRKAGRDRTLAALSYEYGGTALGRQADRRWELRHPAFMRRLRAELFGEPQGDSPPADTQPANPTTDVPLPQLPTLDEATEEAQNDYTCVKVGAPPGQGYIDNVEEAIVPVMEAQGYTCR